MYKRLIVLALALIFTSKAVAAATDYGQPKIGDYEREQFEKLLQDVQELNRLKGEANAKISAARYKFFTTSFKSPEHKKAEVEFANWLQDKDYVFFDMCVKAGAEDGLKRFAFFSGLGGGSLDNGIPKIAIPAFKKWVTVVRSELGVGGDQVYIMTDLDIVIKAMRKHGELYRLYKVERDKAEFLLWRVAHPQKNETEGNLPFVKREIKSLREAGKNAFRLGRVENRQLRNILFDPNYKQKALFCSYGPMPTERGEVLSNYTFWYKTAPENIDELMLMDLGNSLSLLGNKGYVSCPQTDGDAQKEHKAAIKFADSPQFVSKRNELKAISDGEVAKQREKISEEQENEMAERKKMGAAFQRIQNDCNQLYKNYILKYSGSEYKSRAIESESTAVNRACILNKENSTEQLRPVKAKHEIICSDIKEELKREIDTGYVTPNLKLNPESMKKLENSQAFVCDPNFTDIDDKTLSGSASNPASETATTATVEENSTTQSDSSTKPASNSPPSVENSPPATTETPIISQQEAQSVLCKAMAGSIAVAEQNAISMRDKVILVMSKNSYKLKCGGS